MTIREKIQSLINAGNAKTGNDDATLTDVVLSLIDGYLDNKVPAFVADFSGNSPSPLQFYSWESREYGSTHYLPLSSIQCENGVAHFTNIYDSETGKWLEKGMCTAGLFESDNFTLTFKAMFDSTAGSWCNVITYGTGTYWTSNLYSDGVKWPAGGEIDAFEQAGGYSENPNTFSPVFHYGAGSNSYYPHRHDTQSIVSGVSLPLDEWVDCKYVLKDGVVKLYLNGTQIGAGDGSDLVVNNEYLWNYHPFAKPQAFYMACGVAGNSSSIDTSKEHHFYIKDFEVYTESKTDIPCTGLSIYPQMWSRGTSLTFPTNAVIYLDRIYTPADTSNKACTWQSSDPTVATVVQGYVTTLSEGVCTITATCGTATASYNLVVSNSNANVPCAGVTIDSEELHIVGTSTTDLSGIIYTYPRYNTDSVQITSSDTSIVTVSGTSITGTGTEGTATITVKCGNATATVPVTVSSGIILDEDLPAYSSGTSVVMDDYPAYDSTAIYSFQYTFGENNVPRGSYTPNVYVGPAQTNNAKQNGSVSFSGSAQKWAINVGGGGTEITPSVGDVLTIVINMATGKMNAYLNDTQVVTNQNASYLNNTTRVIVSNNNDGATIAPVHLKIAIGDLH